MVKKIRIFRNNEFLLIPVKDYLNEYHKEIPEGWEQISNWIDRVFNVESQEELKILESQMQVEQLNLLEIKKSFLWLKEKYGILSDDILKFIAFLFGTKYFSKVGNPPIDQWFNANDINYPFKISENNVGFSFIDALQFENGENAIRKNLLSFAINLFRCNLYN